MTLSSMGTGFPSRSDLFPLVGTRSLTPSSSNPTDLCSIWKCPVPLNPFVSPASPVRSGYRPSSTPPSPRPPSDHPSLLPTPQYPSLRSTRGSTSSLVNFRLKILSTWFLHTIQDSSPFDTYNNNTSVEEKDSSV